VLTARTLIIIPTYNESENILEIVPRVFSEEPHAHLLLVDDNSPDGTADLAQREFGGDSRFHILRRRGARGLGRSYVDGYLYALENGYARVVQMDADFSHDPRYIPKLIETSQRADVTLGSRYCPGGRVEDWPLRRVMLSRFANFYVSRVTGLGVRDSTSGFRCYTRYALEKIHVELIVSNGYAFQVEMTYRAKEEGLSIVETPIIFTDRRQGRSKISRKVLVESMIMPWKLRFAMHAARKLRLAQSDHKL
jgi:dolichol-phosphate mannosyltransferase